VGAKRNNPQNDWDDAEKTKRLAKMTLDGRHVERACRSCLTL